MHAESAIIYDAASNKLAVPIVNNEVSLVSEVPKEYIVEVWVGGEYQKA